MKTSRWYIAGATLAATAFVATAALLPPLGTVDLSIYEDYAHDSGANTLAMDVGRNAGIVTQCTLVLFDKKCVEKISAPFTNVNGMANVFIDYFEKNWAILRATGSTTIYYSVKISSAPKVLGTQTGLAMNYSYAGKSFVVSYFNSTLTCQVFNVALQPVGAPVATIGRPHKLGSGGFFYCQGGGQTQIWKVKKGLALIVQDAGNFVDINQQKRLCCIQSNTVHKIYAYK